MAATVLPPVRYTRNLFLRCLSAVYLFAFLSIYVQIPGLNGSNGILPARNQLDSVKSRSLSEQMNAKPTLVWLAPHLGLNTEHTLELIALLGAFLAFLGTVTQKLCIAPVFATLWVFYLSLFQVNPVFMAQQWDKLLLETGILCILMAPLTPGGAKKPAPKDSVMLWMVKWLLFRLMFSTCILKFTTKGSKLWWQLAGLDVYFENQWLPNYLSWHSHHLPTWFLHLSTLYTHFTEVAVPFFFFVPLHLAQVVAFYFQIFLQLCILITGNFGFLNLLICALCLSLLDDRNFDVEPGKSSKEPKYSGYSKLMVSVLYGLAILLTWRALGVSAAGQIELQGDPKAVEESLRWFMPVIAGVALASLCLESGKNVTKLLLQGDNCKDKLLPLAMTVCYVFGAVAIFGLSVISLSSVRPASATEPEMMAALRPLSAKFHKWHISSPYSLYLQISDKSVRREVVIEGSNSLKGPWSEFNFRYKPGNVNRSLPVIIPHQPRLDWQMWVAAQGTYQQNPWTLSLAHRLLKGSPEVLQLLDPNSPFMLPPKYVRASLYVYKFSPWSQRNSGAWWVRERKGEYFPIYSADHPPLLDYLKQQKLIGARDWPVRTQWLASALRALRTSLDPSVFIWSFFMAASALIMTGTR